MSDPVASAATSTFDLGTVPVLTLVGPDARRFSNGMFTQNVRDLAEQDGARSAMTDDRGRVLGLLDLYCTAPEDFLLVLEGVDGDWFQERYGMYIVFDDVEMTDLSGSLVLLSVQGSGASAAVSQALDGALADAGHQVLDDVQVLRRDRTGSGGWDLLVPAAGAAAVAASLAAAGAAPGSADDLQALRIHAGLPAWPADQTGERTFVHELRLRDQVCSFNKGCYVGQEVINRMDTMGKLSRQLQGLRVEGTTSPPHGASVLLDDEPVGQLGSAALVGGQIEALAVLRKKAWPVGTRLAVRDGDVQWSATVCDLPFG